MVESSSNLEFLHWAILSDAHAAHKLVRCMCILVLVRHVYAQTEVFYTMSSFGHMTTRATVAIPAEVKLHHNWKVKAMKVLEMNTDLGLLH